MTVVYILMLLSTAAFSSAATSYAKDNPEAPRNALLKILSAVLPLLAIVGFEILFLYLYLIG